MAATLKIQIKRGLKENLPTLSAGEFAFTTDEDMVYIGDGSNNYMVGRVIHDAGTGGMPTAGVSGRVYVDTTAHTIWLDDGITWQQCGASDLADLSGTLDDIADGVSYKKVAASEFATGTNYINQLNDGSNVITASQAVTHITDATKHRVINDAATGTTDLWSAHKILEFVSNNLDGLDWQNSVLSMSYSDPPTGPTEGDRYIVGPSATGGWSGHDGDIAEYRDGVWVFIDPNEGFCAAVEDQNIEYVYNGSEWVSRPAATNHNNLSGLQGGTAGEFYHLSSSDYAALVTNREEYIQDLVGDMASGTGSTQVGITVGYNDPAGKLTFELDFSDIAPPAVGIGSAGTSQDVSRADHTHTLPEISHSSLSGIGANDHHNQVHALVGSDHTATGLTEGQVLRATSGSTFDFGDLDCGTF